MNDAADNRNCIRECRYVTAEPAGGDLLVVGVPNFSRAGIAEESRTLPHPVERTPAPRFPKLLNGRTAPAGKPMATAALKAIHSRQILSDLEGVFKRVVRA